MSKWVSKDDALKKMQRYCAYQDRCHQEVRQKMIEMGVLPDWREEVMVELIQENFLNEERFARSYARGKFRIKQWGRKRITMELKKRNISAYCIRKAMEEIETEDYLSTLKSLVEKKAAALTEDNPFVLKKKISEYLLRRGFESGLIWDTIHKVLAD
jgi:regulatory protein